MAKRRIAVVTGTRAEYGLLVPIMKAIQKEPNLQLQIIATGMHLIRRFGYTSKQIEKDGWKIDAKIRLQNEKDDPIAQSKGLGRAIIGLTEAFEKLCSDIILVLGDRLEIFAAAAAATASQKVLAHIHGGDTAIGVQDEAYRHAITKLAHIHFAASATARQRILRMGEQKWRIYQTGSPAIDNLSQSTCIDEKTLSKHAGFDVKEDFLILLQHPAGSSAKQEEKKMRQSVSGCRHKGLKTIVLYPNCDPGFSGIVHAIKAIEKQDNCHVIRQLPREIYLGLLAKTKVLVGNSSSGIIEAGYLNVDVVNVGPRQQGRQRTQNVKDANYGRDNVARAIKNIMTRQKIAKRPKKCRIYGSGNSGQKIASLLDRIQLDRRLRQKKIAY